MGTGNVILVCALAIVFGFSTDFADLLDEHGLKWFPGAAVLFGFIWGGAGAAMMLVYSPASIFVVGLLLYWISVGKIDYLNHKIAALLILLLAGYQVYAGSFEFILTGSYLLMCLALGLANSFLKKRYGHIPFAWIRQCIPALVISLFTGNPAFIIMNLSTMLGYVISDRWFMRFEKNKDSSFFKKMGFSISR